MHATIIVTLFTYVEVKLNNQRTDQRSLSNNKWSCKFIIIIISRARGNIGFYLIIVYYIELYDG